MTKILKRLERALAALRLAQQTKDAPKALASLFIMAGLLKEYNRALQRANRK